MTDGRNILSEFLAAVRAIEKAWLLLDTAGPADIDEAIRLGDRSAQVLTRAASLLSVSAPDRAHRLLERAVMLDAAPAPTQLALARSFRSRGDRAEASRWLRGAILRSRPDAALLLELAAIESDHAGEIIEVARICVCRDAVAAADAAKALAAAGRCKEARIACTMAFQAGAREEVFVTLYSELLADLTNHEVPALPNGPLGMPHWWEVATFAAQAKLAHVHPPELLIAGARAREASSRWIGNDRLAAFLAERIQARLPFSWVRLGDGEARFLLHVHPELRASLPAREAGAVARQIWFSWFGQDLDQVPRDSIAILGERLERAICNADLLGVASAERLENDSVHYGFCAALEAYVIGLSATRMDTLLCDAMAPVALNQRYPFLDPLLRNLDFLGVISPHADLAERLAGHLNISKIASYELPGESRLGRAVEAGNRGTHFPIVYERLMATISVPYEGAVFLVAGGLLGKIYCDRVRELGGIALDIGAIVDAWMGYNTRGAPLDEAMRRQLPGRGANGPAVGSSQPGF